MDITKKHNTEIYKDEQHGRHHQKHNTEIYKDEQHGTSPKNITQKYIKMSNMDHQQIYTEIYKDEQHGHHQKT